MRKTLVSFLAGFALLFIALTANAQIAITVSGTAVTSPALAPTYTSLALALTDINAIASYTTPGTIILTCTAGTSETAPVKGFILGSSTLNPLLSATNTITIVKASGTVTINAGVGTSASPSATSDGMFVLNGADYVTIDGLTFTDGNTASATVAMEFGIGLFKRAAGDGSNNNTIQNCTFNMQRISNGAGTTPMLDGSWAIEVLNSTYGAATTPLTPTNGGTLATNGTNSANKFYTNTINGGNGGIGFGGYAAVTGVGPTPTATTFLGDLGNDVGGSSTGQGNQILNFGGGAATNPSAGIRANNEWSLNISNNTINNNNGSGTNHATTLRGIYAQAGTSANITIYNNTVTVKSGATTSALTAIENSIGTTAAANTIIIRKNTITGCTYSAATSGAFTGITNTSSAANLYIDTNTFTSNTTSATSGTTNEIVNSAVNTVSVNINGNSLGGITFSAATSGQFNGINQSGTTVAALLTIAGNNFSNITYSVTSSCIVYPITWVSATSSTELISGNTFTNLTLNTTGTVAFMYHSTGNLTATGIRKIVGNSIVTQFTKSGTGGTMYCFYQGASAVTGSYCLDSANNFSNITLTGACTFNGMTNLEGNSSSSAPTKTVVNNVVSNVTTGGAAATGIAVGYALNPTIVKNNIVSGITSTATSVAGLNVGSNIGTAGTLTISYNKVSNLECNAAAGITYGIYHSAGGTTVNIFNNMVGDLRNTSGSNTTVDVVRGIALVSTQTTQTVNLSFNTIYLNCSTGGANFTTTALYQTGSATATTNTLVSRNNIIDNNSIANGSGLAIAFRRSLAALNDYSTSSDRNDYYAGPSSATHLIYYDGTNSDQTLGTFKTRVSTADVNSISENPTFISTTSGNANYLKINTSSPTQVESGGANVSGITDDFENDIRQGNGGYPVQVNGGGTAPDIGADEFDGTPAASMTYSSSTTEQVTGLAYAGQNNQSIVRVKVVTTGSLSPLSLTSLTLNANGTTSIGDINATTAKVYYTGSSTTFSTGTLVGATTPTIADFNVTASQVLSQGDNYFWLAYDIIPAATSGNVIDGECNSITVGSPYTPTATAPAGNKTIVGAMTGNYAVGTGQTYTTLTAAIADLNLRGVSAAVTFTLMDATYSGETLPITISAFTGASASNTLTIKPNTSVNATISGTTSGNPLLRLNGADYVVIDGSNNGSSSKNLTFTNLGTGANTGGVALTSLGAGLGATNNVLKNCVISTSAAAAGAISFGVSVGGSTTGTTGADNDNVTVQNNTISGVSTGIYASGTAAVSSGGDDNLLITGNTVTSSTSIQNQGIQVANSVTSAVTSNTISVTSTGTVQPVGISVETGFVTSSISKNTITNVLANNTGGYGARGITIGTGTATSGDTIANNIIYGVNGSNYSGFTNSSSMGICIGTVGGSGTLTTTAGGLFIYYNSVNMYGNHDRASACLTAALYVGTGASALNIKNNIFSNFLNNTNTGGTGSKDYCIYSAAANTAFTSIDYNEYYPLTPAGTYSTGYVGFIGSDRSDITAWRTGSGQDVHSVQSNPLWVSNTDLEILAGSPAYHAGTPVSVVYDYAGTARDGSTPSIGAYESQLNAGPVISYSALTSTTGTGNRALGSVTITDGDGVASGSLAPRIYWKVNAGSFSYANSAATPDAGSPYSFTIGTSGLSSGDVVSYFVVAQDLLGAVKSNPATGLVATDVNTISSYPSSPNTYTIVGAPLAGDYIVGDGAFQRFSGLHIEFEQRTRKVMKEAAADNSNKSAIANDVKDMKKSNAKVDGSENQEPITSTFADNTFSKSAKVNKNANMVEVEETYKVPMLNGKEYTGSLYHAFTKEEKDQLHLLNPDMTPGVYATLTAAVTDVNLRGVGASDCRFILDDATYSGESLPIIIQSTTSLPTASSKLIIKPNTGVSPTISGSSASGVIVSMAPYVTIDGTSIGSSGTRNLSITNTSSAASTYVVGMFNNTSPNKADHNTVQYCNITGGSTSNTNAIYGIIMNAAGGDFDNCLIDNNVITKVKIGIQAAGVSGFTSDNCTISNNTIGSTTDASSVFSQCIVTSFTDNLIITNNELIGQVAGNGGNSTTTFSTTNINAGIVVTNTSSNTKIRKNKIHDFYYNGTAGYAGFGIMYANGTGANSGTTEISNNVIYSIKGDGDDPTAQTNFGYFPQGICIQTNGTSAIQIYYNSIYMSGAYLTFTAGTSSTIGVYAGTGAGSIDIRNNLLRNSQTGGTGKTMAILSTGSGTSAMFSQIDYNNYYIDGQSPQFGYLSGYSATLAAWKSATTKDVSSISGRIPFTSTTNLVVASDSATAWYVHGMGSPTATSISTDYTGAARSITIAGGSTDLGAYNVTPSSAPPVATASAGPAPSTTTTYTFAGKTIGSITWDASVTPPTQIDAQYYPGTYPLNSNLQTRSNCYWVFTATGGSGYSYNITLNYDPADLGDVSNNVDLRIAKSASGSDWFLLDNGFTTLDSVAHTITYAGLNSFSHFTLTDKDAPLPVEFASFTANVDHRNIELNWSTVSEQNNAGFDIERKLVTDAASAWSKVGHVAGHGNSNVTNTYNFKERNLPTASYNYRLKQLDNNGNFTYHALSNEVIIGVPTKFDISQNYPNPFNPTTKINFDLPFDSKVQIVLFDMTGRQVATILNANQSAGYQTVSFNASNLSSGAYFYQINAVGGSQSFVKTMKMMLVK